MFDCMEDSDLSATLAGNFLPFKRNVYSFTELNPCSCNFLVRYYDVEDFDPRVRQINTSYKLPSTLHYVASASRGDGLRQLVMPELY